MSFSSPGIRYGVLGGVTVLLFFLVVYVANPPLFLNLGIQYGSLLFYAFFMYQTARSDMEQLGTERDFRDMVRQPFLAFLIINLFYWLFYYALHLFDKGLIVTELNIELNNLKAQLEAGLGDPQQGNIFRERIAELEKAIQSPPGQPLGPVITRMLMGALGGFGLAAAIVALVRTKK